jgi:hypothetical protein
MLSVRTAPKPRAAAKEAASGAVCQAGPINHYDGDKIDEKKQVLMASIARQELGESKVSKKSSREPISALPHSGFQTGSLIG